MGREGEPTVLVVEDAHELADIYGEHLNRTATVEVVYDGESALTALEDRSFDVVLLDRRMPGLSGDEVLRELRDRELDSGVIMISAVQPDFDIISLEFDDYLTKPVSADELRGAVDRITNLRGSDEIVREYLSLRQKRDLLAVQQSTAAREASEAYASLERRMDELTERAERTGTALPD